MAMFMVKPWYRQASFNPFDPVTNTATEADFIKLLQLGIYDSQHIGKFVTLSNSVANNGGKYVIADVNHDSANTGQTNCYDLISVDCIVVSAVYGNEYWRSSNIRSWLVNTLYPGYSSDLKSHAMNIKYVSNGSWYSDDKITTPSFTEVNGSTGTSQSAIVEGVAYPIFTNSASRIKNQVGGSEYYWWTRTRKSSYCVFFVMTDGGLLVSANTSSTGGVGTVPILRVH